MKNTFIIMLFRKQIPNLITLSNLTCGVLAIIFLFQGKYAVLPSLLILLGAVFDFFDGMVARLLRVSSKIGVELDSLADVITFGVAPSFIAFDLVQKAIGNGWNVGAITPVLPYLTLIMAPLSAFRLAKFNIDERQTHSFLGMPTPMNAFFWLSIPLIVEFSENKGLFRGIPPEGFYENWAAWLSNPWFVIIAAWVLGILLVTELPLFALKLKSLTWNGNAIPFTFLAISGILILLFSVVSIPFIVLLYVLLSIISNIRQQ